MSFNLRRRRLLAYVMLLVMPLAVTYSAIQVATAIHVRYVMEQYVQQLNAVAGPNLAYYQSLLAILQSNQPDPRFDQLSEDERAGLVFRLRQLITKYQGINRSLSEIRHSYLAAVAEAVFMPAAATSSGVIEHTVEQQPYPAPNQIHEMAIQSFTTKVGRPGSGYIAALDDAIPKIVAWLSFAGVSLLIPPLFLLLLASRRKAKVRWRHLFRVWAYGMWIPLATGMGLAAMLGIGVFDNDWWRTLDSITGGLPSWIFGLLLICWWWAATARYLRMPHSLGIAALLTTVGGLIMLAIIWYGWQEFLIEL